MGIFKILQQNYSMILFKQLSSEQNFQKNKELNCLHVKFSNKTKIRTTDRKELIIAYH